MLFYYNLHDLVLVHNNMIRLVQVGKENLLLQEPNTFFQVYHPDLVQSTHTHLAQELEGEGNHKNAENHFIAAGDWKSAVHMYRGVDLWEDAYRCR